MVICADSQGNELMALNYNQYDFEIGDDVSDYWVTMLIPDWQDIPTDARIFIPDTEYGGIYKRLETDTKVGTISVGGFTWRGMMRNKIICPPVGEDYASDVGDINTIIGNRVSQAFSGLFVGKSPCGVSVGYYQYNRYCTLYDGLTAMLASVGHRLQIAYDITIKRVVVSAMPIIDHSQSIEFSSDVSSNYYMQTNKTGVNHLICLGSGELRNRTVVNLYTDARGRISQTQTFKGSDEIAQVYDYAGADRLQLIQSGTEQLQNLSTANQFSIDVEGLDLEIGDIVGGKDYVSGMTMKANIVGKVHKSEEGHETTEYTISDNVEVTNI